MERKYRVCHICSYYETPIFSDFILHQIEFTVPRVFYYQHYKHKFLNGDEAYVDKCPCYSKWQRAFFYAKQGKAIQKYKEYYQDSNIELNFSHSLFTNGYVAYKVKLDWKIPYIVAIQNTDINVFFKYLFFLRKTGIEILREAEAVVLASDSYKETLLKQYIPKKYRAEIEKKILVVPYGINDFYSDNRFDGKKIIKDKIKIISVGRIETNKNQLLICKALESGTILDKPVELKIIGEDVNGKLLKKICSYRFVKYFSYMDKNELMKQYRNSDIFILTSKTETFGLVYAEALSQGLPIIYTSNQGFDKQFDEGFIGYHAKLEAKELKRKIENIVKNYGYLQGNCVNASRKFEWKSISKQYAELYWKILSN
ncbi:glycosyltransferase family 4 protein [[Clostridium] symbiosum]|uniref:glycosyltransferase family 4 protein n=1 Tax=Clostridium symbiosum TaxID=1512 RepID=UPI001D091DF6|nr:glycosyltransferase family 4 protein [[Clostridium] symbiosum]MCB6610937.1 glycosyltransferase family 4 protein [[Clostridium] symbiosum]MCB6931617.1 glycosyltransferase family 4 protein [[Clostridium] symbiosum]